ncbi:hypothetical protein ACT17_15250 [Mycolicibacterium conceptionense]|uniref:Uncharacterized protein n=1 Tax=Mycolicibacterium conceptionense TaxID=451644 RepID=A0A0J8WX76_9MYCO|nr:hypothetical protein [Mycolicibacterium conceptionense]KMV17634.1 hypothetical protein ACT17_15250 [Mycolicibacterium conceptionense]
MALIATMRVNNDFAIGHLYAQRIAGTNDPDSIGRYRVDIAIGDTADGAPEEFFTVFVGEIDHRYGDGGWALVSKVITSAGLDQPGAAERLRAQELAARDGADVVTDA